MAKIHHKGRLHEKIKVGTLVAEIRLNDAGKFSCQIGPDTQWGDLPTLRRWATEKLHSNLKLEWHPVMCVAAQSDDVSVNNGLPSASLQYYIERFYVAWNGKRWIQCDWSVHALNTFRCDPHNPSNEEQDYMKPEELAYVRSVRAKDCYFLEGHSNVVKWPIVKQSAGWGNGHYYVPYTEANWQTMLGVMDKMREIRTKVATMLSTEQGWVQLAQIANVNLLAAPATKPKRLGTGGTNIHTCVVCHENPVQPALGEDTCFDCLKNV